MCGRLAVAYSFRDENFDLAMTQPTLTFSDVVNVETSNPVQELIAQGKIGPVDGVGKTAVVAMSGGVDSAVTALIMRERGYRVIGMNLRLFSPDDPDHRANPCCGIPAMDDARMTCARIGVPFYALNMETEFSEAVVDRFVNEYAAGRTPNPCLECNRHVKFRHLVQKARALGADCLATGHYARIINGNDDGVGQHKLYRAVDERKDQSYVLYTLNQDQLGFIQFPLGGLRKPEVRQLAHHFELPVADKPESQEICFVGDRSYAEFVAERRPDVTKPGEIVNQAGAKLGEHRGLVRHTIGQRRGIGIPQAEPLYVLQLDAKANRLVVGSRKDAEALTLEAEDVSFTSGIIDAAPIECEASVRYRGRPTAVQVTPLESGRARIVVEGDGPIAAPGQAIVFYRDDEVLGGGTISHVVRRTE